MLKLCSHLATACTHCTVMKISVRFLIVECHTHISGSQCIYKCIPSNANVIKCICKYHLHYVLCLLTREIQVQ